MKAKRIGISILTLCLLVIACITLVQIFSWREVKITLDTNYLDFISQNQMKEKGHFATLPEFDSEVSIGFQNIDKTKTLYIYSAPIRFLNSDNSYSFIDSRIINTPEGEARDHGYIYTVAQNNVVPYFPKKLSDKKGILLCQDDLQLHFIPQTENSALAEYKTENNFIDKELPMVLYRKIFQDEDNLAVYPTSLGFNMEYSGKFNSNCIMKFNLQIREEDILIRRENGGYLVLYKNEIDNQGNSQETILSIIHPPLIHIDNTILYGNHVEFKKIAAQEYTISFSVHNDADIIGKRGTSFISVEMRKEKQADNTLYSKHPFLTNIYLSNYAVLGESQDLGIGEALIRYKFVKNFNLSSEQIISAKYYTYCLTKNHYEYEVLPMLEDWCSITGNWSKNYKTGESFYNTVSSTNIICLDLTKEAQKWCMDDGQMEHNGIKLKQKEEKEGAYDVFLTNDNTLYKNVTEVVLK